jgi:putative flippase GtrA
MVRLWPQLARIEQHPLARFTAIGIFVTALDFAVFNAIVAAYGGPPTREYALLANTLAFATAACVGYMLHARYTFGVERDWGSFARYGLVAVVGAAIYDLGLLFILWLPFESNHVLALNAAKAGAAAIAAIWNFQGFRIFSFGRSQRRTRRPDGAS